MIKHGKHPFLECSTKGDKRFSAFCARIRRRGDRTIEEIYQGAKIFDDGTTDLTWREAKGRHPVNHEQVRELYSQLWDEYIEENPELMSVLRSASGLQDTFGQKGSVCQASELWRIRNRPARQDDVVSNTISDLEEMIDDDAFSWAHDTLSGILSWVEENHHVTPRQLQAIDNISSRCRR